MVEVRKSGATQHTLKCRIREVVEEGHGWHGKVRMRFWRLLAAASEEPKPHEKERKALIPICLSSSSHLPTSPFIAARATSKLYANRLIFSHKPTAGTWMAADGMTSSTWHAFPVRSFTVVDGHIGGHMSGRHSDSSSFSLSLGASFLESESPLSHYQHWVGDAERTVLHSGTQHASFAPFKYSEAHIKIVWAM